MTAVVLGLATLERHSREDDRYMDGDYTATTPHLRWHPVGTLWERLADHGR